jgi:hypothetical protein
MKRIISYLLLVVLSLVSNVSGNTTNIYSSDKFEETNGLVKAELSIVKTEVEVSEHDVKLINKAVFTKMACERESRGKYNVANEFKYVGKYQMGRIALRDIGYAKSKIDSIRNSVYSVENSKGKKLYYFDTKLFTPEEQELAICKYFHKIEKRYLKKDIERYVGKTIDGVYITKAGILGASMLGCGYVDNFLKSGGKDNPTDAYGTSVKSRLILFQDFELNSCY